MILKFLVIFILTKKKIQTAATERRETRKQSHENNRKLSERKIFLFMIFMTTETFRHKSILFFNNCNNLHYETEKKVFIFMKWETGNCGKWVWL